MKTETIVLVIALVIVCDVLTFALLRLILGAPFRGLASRFPPMALGPDAIARDNQTIRLGAGQRAQRGVRIGVDSFGLHVVPSKIFTLLGARAFSVPWAHVRVDPAQVRGGLVACELGEARAQLPAWCVLDEPDAPQGAAGA